MAAKGGLSPGISSIVRGVKLCPCAGEASVHDLGEGISGERCRGQPLEYGLARMIVQVLNLF